MRNTELLYECELWLMTVLDDSWPIWSVFINKNEELTIPANIYDCF